MKREFTIALNDQKYPIIVEQDTITVNGRPFTVEVIDGTVLVDGIAYDVALAEQAALINGESHPLQVDGLSLAHASASPTPSGSAALADLEAGAGAVLAIMPGKIIRVMVETGQQVEEGDPVCVLEAMKMENELHARQSGTVKAIHVKAGIDVEKDQVLIEIE